MNALAWMAGQIANAPKPAPLVITGGAVEGDIAYLVEFVRRKGSVSQADIREACGWTYDQTRRRLEAAIKHKRLTVSGKTSDRRYKVRPSA